MKYSQLWLPEVKYTLIAVAVMASLNLYSRFYTVTESRPQQSIDAEAEVQVPTPPLLTAALEPLLLKLQPVASGDTSNTALPVDPAAGQLGSLQVSLKAVFLQDGQRKAVLRLVDGSSTELKTVRLQDEVSGYRVTILQQDSVIFQQGDQRVVLRLFKNNTAAGQPAQGN